MDNGTVNIDSAESILKNDGVLEFQLDHEEAEIFKTVKCDVDELRRLMHTHGSFINRLKIFVMFITYGSYLQFKVSRKTKDKQNLEAVVNIYENCWNNITVVKGEALDNGKVKVSFFKLA